MLKMKFRYKISILPLFVIFTSCDDWSHGKFEITNKTTITIDSIYIQPDQAAGKHFISLKPNETKYYVSDMTRPSGTDGAYRIQYKLGSNAKSQIFGYYSNGNSIEKLTKITILIDTVLFKFIN